VQGRFDEFRVIFAFSGILDDNHVGASTVTVVATSNLHRNGCFQCYRLYCTGSVLSVAQSLFLECSWSVVRAGLRCNCVLLCRRHIFWNCVSFVYGDVKIEVI